METFKTVHAAKLFLRGQIVAAQFKIESSPYTLAQSIAADNRLTEIHAADDMRAETNKAELSDVLAKVKLVQDMKERDRLEETLNTDLMIIDPAANYILVEKGESLISPSGFHPSQLVFIKTRAAVQVSRLPRSSNLIAYNLNSLTY